MQCTCKHARYCYSPLFRHQHVHRRARYASISSASLFSSLRRPELPCASVGCSRPAPPQISPPPCCEASSASYHAYIRQSGTNIRRWRGAETCAHILPAAWRFTMRLLDCCCKKWVLLLIYCSQRSESTDVNGEGGVVLYSCCTVLFYCIIISRTVL